MPVRRSVAKFLVELVSLRKKYPTKRILMSKADLSDAFRNVRVDPYEAHKNFSPHGRVVVEFRLAFGWPGSPSFWGVMSAAAEHAHCNTTSASAQILSEGADTTAHVKVVDRWEDRNPTTVPADAKVRAHLGGEKADPFFATGYVDDYPLIRV